MAIAGDQNPWWWDVLENGPSSLYATFFDVDWEASEERWPNKVLLPVLGDHYGRVLERGEIELRQAEGAFTLHYFEHAFPVDPSSLVDLLARAAARCGSDELGFLAESHGRMPRPTVTRRESVQRRHRDKGVLRGMLRRLCAEAPAVARAVQAEVDRCNEDPDLLDALLDDQNYRLALWRTADRDLGYRRFFDIHGLAGLRVEEEEVFTAAHALPLRWVEEGRVDGLRIDHPDGLRRPAEYFARLREACPQAWIVAEKILEPGEQLPADWPVAGSTGYDFLRRLTDLLVDPEGEAPLDRLWREWGGEEEWEEVALESKRLVLRELLGSELNTLTAHFVAVCERHRRHRDYTRHELGEALLEVAAAFAVYRTYARASDGHLGGDDRRRIDAAVERARALRPDLDDELFAFLARILRLEISGEQEGELAMRFQQLTGPAMAKGVEDTAFYRYHRLIALNEVGGDPSGFGGGLERFHADCEQAQERRPRAMLTTSTHDTKRSEDVRARLAVLSEMPGPWAEAVRGWRRRNDRHRGEAGPDPGLEYLFYQTLVGAWPLTVERVEAYMEKAAREAKVHTSWVHPEPDFEADLARFVRDTLHDEAFRSDLEAFVSRVVGPGRINSLSQTLLKLTVPGVPDLYQGCELWDLSLVDPDNRLSLIHI